MLHFRLNLAGTLIEEYVTDFSGRKPENCSPFMYALWAMDAHMLKMMLESLQKAFNKALEKSEEGATGEIRKAGMREMEECEEIRQKLMWQFMEVTFEGLSYTHAQTKMLNGIEVSFFTRVENETHFNFQPLLDALRAYIEQFEHWTWAEREQHWCHIVGGAQQDIPAHAAQEYCHPDKSFYLANADELELRSLFKFDDTRFPRSLEFYNYLVRGPHRWWSSRVDSRFGFDFGVIRGRQSCGVGASGGVAWANGGYATDFAALTALSEVRSQDMANIESQLLNLFQTQAQESGLRIGMSGR